MQAKRVFDLCMHTNLQEQALGKKKKKKESSTDEETTVSQGQDLTRTYLKGLFKKLHRLFIRWFCFLEHSCN